MTAAPVPHLHGTRATMNMRLRLMTGHGNNAPRLARAVPWRCALGLTICLAMALALARGSAFAREPERITGLASFYGKNYRGPLASGGRYDPYKFTAAHRSLPFGTHLRVTDPRTQRSVTVVVNDRGPFIKGRVLDLSYAAAKALHMTQRGVARVTAMVVR